ncbi:MAG TPA: ion transporter [Candidatus Nitrosopolaris sp.]|nr:ion transporter [Candidatus Nitrosopolaris sp.]
MQNDDSNPHEEVGIFQIVILILSFIVLGALVADAAFNLPLEVSGVLRKLDTLVCIVFLVDVCVRFHRAKTKLAFLKWGWIDAMASIPYLPILRWGRLVRVLQIIRLIRALRATHKITALLLKNRFQTGVASVILTSFLVIIFGSLGILICEQPDPQANIKTADDALWWSVATVTTVGSTDKYPVTTEGRLLAMIVMFCGVGLFGGMSGLAASFFIGAKEKTIVTEENKILARLEKLEEKIDRLKQDDK